MQKAIYKIMEATVHPRAFAQAFGEAMGLPPLEGASVMNTELPHDISEIDREALCRLIKAGRQGAVFLMFIRIMKYIMPNSL